MRVKLDRNTDGVGGVARVYSGLYQYLPDYGIEIVDSLEQADVVHAHIALYEKIPVDMPLVVSSHGMLWEEDNWGGSAQTINKMCIDAYRQADVITTPSKFVAYAIARNMSVAPKVVHHGVDSDVWVPGENEGYVLWNKARVDAANNPKDVTILASLAKDVPFVSTYGDEAENIKIIGQIPHDDMLSYVQHAGVYFDTPKESGGPCFGVLEAMSCGVPILSWNWGGTAEAVVHKETGYLAEPGDYQDLLAGLMYCIQHRKEMSQAARQTVIEKYQWSQVIGGYVQAYEEAISKHQHSTTVSVIIPCYNLAAYLPSCLDSVISQSFTDWEAIVVDDASTDNSLKVAQKYAKLDDRIKVIHNSPNQHVAYSRNIGIENSSGKYILPLDADDRLDQGALQHMVSALDNNRALDIVSGKLLLFDDGEYTVSRQGEWPNNTEVTLQLKGYNRLPYASMYRRKVWENIGGYRTRIRNGVEDADFWTRALSYGHKADIINHNTLLYTMRQNSLGKQNSKGTEAWLPWFGWASNPNIVPFGADIFNPHVQPYDHPEVSVVIPVGPGHGRHIQACIDSLLAQTNPKWEAIVINDTGKAWGSLRGMPYVTLIDGDENEGVAAARNKGIKAARTEKIIFLDVDDVAQPLMVDMLLKAHEAVGGWIYADWYVIEGEKAVLHRAMDWNLDYFRTKMLGPVTGLYEKKHLLEIGGFNEAAPGWEDWDMQLALVSRGYCGTRLQYPIITYNMDAGFRREENFSRADNLLQYIKNKYGERRMGCSKCGGKSTLKVNTDSVAASNTSMLLVAYTGPMSQIRRIKSKYHPGTVYLITNTKPVYMFPDDAEFFLTMKDYKVINQPQAFTGTEQAVISSQEKAPEVLIDDLELSPESKAFLKTAFKTAADITRATDADILQIKGIGQKRLKEIREAVHA